MKTINPIVSSISYDAVKEYLNNLTTSDSIQYKKVAVTQNGDIIYNRLTFVKAELLSDTASINIQWSNDLYHNEYDTTQYIFTYEKGMLLIKAEDVNHNPMNIVIW